MQRVPENLLRVGVEYRIHSNADCHSSRDYIGTLLLKDVFDNEEPRLMFNNVVEPVPDAQCINGEVEHRRMAAPGYIMIDPKKHTFFVTARNMSVKRVIASKTNSIVHDPSIRDFFGRKSKRLTKGMPKRSKKLSKRSGKMSNKMRKK
jgi:hypothetical protein